MLRRTLLTAALLATILSLPSCRRDDDLEQDVERLHPTSRPAYYEVKHEGAVYVLGTMASYNRAREGQFPARTIRRNAADGSKLYFEADDRGMEHRLMADYNRRHGLSGW